MATTIAPATDKGPMPMSMSTPSAQAVKVHVTASADVEAIRSETFNGRTYTVVPVVGLVEGVLQGLNAAFPEYAPAEEFGKFPGGWNGRPVVMNHPQVDGVLVSANSPQVLEDWGFGLLFNAELDGDKLKFEAWIDDAEAEAKGGEFASTLQRLKDGKEVEVSTGLFTDVVEISGMHNGTQYSGRWTNVVPDHLAMLSEGTLGACSFENGCGAPRLNASQGTRQLLSAPAVLGARSSKKPKKEEQMCSSEGGCTCGGTCGSTTATTATATTPEEVSANATNAATIGLSLNAIPADMITEDARRLVTEALQQLLGKRYVYINAMTTEVVVFEAYSPICSNNCGCGCGCSYSGMYEFFQLAYEVQEDITVTFSGDPVPVNLITKIVPKPGRTESQTPAAVTANGGANPTPTPTTTETTPATTNEDTQMAGNTGTGEAPAAEQAVVAAAPASEAPPAAPEAAAPAVAANAAPQGPRTLEDFMGSMPPELRESISAGMKMHADAKKKLVEGLLANSRNTFTEAQLNKKDLEELQALAKLADVPVTYEGRAVPTAQDFSANANNDRGAVEAPRAFEAGSKQAGRPGILAEKTYVN